MPISIAEINDKTLRATLPPQTQYYLLLLLLAGGVGGLFVAWTYQIFMGLGVAGIHDPVDWGVYIINFVFWVGIAHSGTLISAILYLLRARWRDAVSRSSEAMTVFAVMIAGLFPLIHLGRVWVVYFILPYPTERGIYPNFVSPLVWDVLAVSTYLSVSVMFFLVGLIPDTAAARDWYEEKEGPGHFKTRLYRVMALGWSGSSRQWQHYDRAYLYFAAMATPLVISVHSIVSWDFAMSLLTGWHTTIYPPYFVAGAIHSGLAMVLLLMIPMRGALNLKRLLEPHHFDMIAKTMLVTTAIMGYSYIVEPFMAWYTGNVFERQFAAWRMTGWVAPVFWAMIPLNVLIPMLLAFKRLRQNQTFLMFAAASVVAGMWLERFMIITGSTGHDFMPHNWDSYFPTWVEITIAIGSFCLFFLLFLVFAKLLPTMPIADLKAGKAERQFGKALFSTGPEEKERPDKQVAAVEDIAGAGGILMEDHHLVAVYRDPGSLIEAVKSLRAAGFTRLDAYSPVKVPQLMLAMGRTGSPVRFITLTGAILGLLGGFWLAGGTAAANHLIVGGKGAQAWMPFCIPAFEGTILIGVTANLAALIWFSRLTNWKTRPAYDRRFSADKFGLVLQCPPTLKEKAGKIIAPTNPEEYHEYQAAGQG